MAANPHACRQLGVSLEASGEESEASAGQSDSEASSFEITLDFVGLGPLRVDAKQTQMIYDGHINADTIKRLVLAMNLQTGEVWGKAREH